MNLPLLQKLCRSQATLLLGATLLAAVMSGGDLYHSVQWGTASSSSVPLVLSVLGGILATFPMIGMSQAMVEQSDSRNAHHVQFSTSHAVMSLFGRRHAPKTADIMMMRPEETATTTSTAAVMCGSLGLTMATAASEELVFRGFLPTAICTVLSWTTPLHPVAILLVALTGQALLFGLGHWHPTSRAGENQLVVQLQTVHGLWHGLVYLASGGNLLVCIISHMLYDMHVFCETWHRMNNQIDWTTQQQRRLQQNQQDDLAVLQKEIQVTDETLSHLESFFLSFDRQHELSLSLEDVQRAVAYAFWHDAVVPDQQQVEEVFEQLCNGQKRLALAGFVRLLLILRSQTQPQQ